MTCCSQPGCNWNRETASSNININRSHIPTKLSCSMDLVISIPFHLADCPIFIHLLSVVIVTLDSDQTRKTKDAVMIISYALFTLSSFPIKVVTLSTISADSSISLAGVGVGVAGSWPWVVLVMMLLVLALLILVVYFRSKFVSLSYNIRCLYSCVCRGAVSKTRAHICT